MLNDASRKTLQKQKAEIWREKAIETKQVSGSY